jgi:3-methylfumaryl-CoA hydratase
MTDAEKPMTRQTDVMDTDRARAMQATLRETPTLAKGDPLPAFFHQLYFWTLMRPDQLGRDGHPARGQGVIPDLGLPRRMWAGGRIDFHAPLILGTSADLVTTLEKAERKTGRSGPLGIVTLRLDYRQNNKLCISEQRDLIYREDPDPHAPKPIPPTAPSDAEDSRVLSFDTTLLFRYSALTFNGHRIHYDLDYATGTEGYRGLVVHGPLLAQHLIRLVEDTLGPVAAFRFRATSPLMHFEQAKACRAGNRFWIEGPDGRMCMEADVTTHA